MKMVLQLFILISFVPATFAQNYPDWPDGAPQFDQVEMEDFTLFNDFSIISDESKVRKRLGAPDTTWFLPRNATLIDVKKYNPNRKFLSWEEYSTLKETYDGSTFPKATFRYDSLAIIIALREGYAYIADADWEKNPELIIKHPVINLNSSTTLDQFQKAFPNSYVWRNYGTSSYRAFHPEVNPENITFIRLVEYVNNIRERPLWVMELAFVEKKLKHMYLQKAEYYE
jgi:hypothetical protein